MMVVCSVFSVWFMLVSVVVYVLFCRFDVSVVVVGVVYCVKMML